MQETEATTTTSRRSSSERGRRVAHAVDLVVDERVLLDVGVGLRDVGLGLVVVVVRHEVLDRVLREEGLELAEELGGQRLVGRQHQGGPVHAGDQVGDRVGLARPGHAAQHRVAAAPANELRRGRLMACGWSPRGEYSDVSLNTAPRRYEGVGTATRYLRHESKQRVRVRVPAACGSRTRTWDAPARATVACRPRRAADCPS